MKELSSCLIKMPARENSNIGSFEPELIKDIFRRYRLRPKKGLGQNFLLDKPIFKKIVAAAELQPKDTVLEIGPGIGNLTWELAKKVKKVIAVEKDQKLAEILKENIKTWEYRNITVVEGDILKFQISKCSASPKISPPEADKFQLPIYKAVANLPYYIVSPVIRKFLESENQPALMVLMVQKEVAQRIASRPPKMNLLAVAVQFYAEPKIIGYVSKKSFWPQPKVDSAIIKIKPRVDRDGKRPDKDVFFKILRAGFKQPRKQILNNFSKELKLNKEMAKGWLLENKLLPSQRPATLTMADWERLAKTFNNL